MVDGVSKNILSIPQGDPLQEILTDLRPSVFLKRLEEISEEVPMDGVFRSRKVKDLTPLLKEACDLLIELKNNDVPVALQKTLLRKVQVHLVAPQSPCSIQDLAAKAKIAFSLSDIENWEKTGLRINHERTPKELTWVMLGIVFASAIFGSAWKRG